MNTQPLWLHEDQARQHPTMDVGEAHEILTLTEALFEVGGFWEEENHHSSAV